MPLTPDPGGPKTGGSGSATLILTLQGPKKKLLSVLPVTKLGTFTLPNFGTERFTNVNAFIPNFDT
jgi:hypothetical protein